MRILSCVVAVAAVGSLAVAAEAIVINVHNANNFANGDGTLVNLFVGQGAFPDPGNNVWNTTQDEPTEPTNNLLASDGTATGVSIVSTAVANNGGIGGNGYPTSTVDANGVVTGTPGNILQGTPGYIVGQAQLGPAITVTLSDVPAGTYSLYVYSGNFDQDRGSSIAVRNAAGTTGAADMGLNFTQNVPPSTPSNQGGLVGLEFAQGVNYALFNDVVVGTAGTLAIDLTPRLNAITGQTGEANFNGLQLVSEPIPEPASLGLLAAAGAGLLARRRRNG